MALGIMVAAAPLRAQLPAPKLLATEGLFQDKAAVVGKVYITGQPTEAGLRQLKSEGVTTVVSLRTPEEMARLPFDEAKLAASLGMRYVNLPVRGNRQYPYSPATLDAFAKAVAQTKGKVLLHCTVAYRASHLWAAYLIREKGLPVDEVVKHAHAINLMEDMRTGTQGRQPVEDFLNRALPQLTQSK